MLRTSAVLAALGGAIVCNAASPPPPVAIAVSPFPTATPGPIHRYMNYNLGGTQCTPGIVTLIPDLVGQMNLNGTGTCSALVGGVGTTSTQAGWSTLQAANPSDGSPNFSVVISMYRTGTPGTNSPVFTYMPTTGSNAGLGPVTIAEYVASVTGFIVAYPACPAGVLFPIVTTAYSTTNFQVAVVFSQSNGVSVYVNGVPTTRSAYDMQNSPTRGCRYGTSAPWDPTTTGTLTINPYMYNGAGTLGRAWQDMQFYNYELTPQQVAALYTYPLSSPPPATGVGALVRTPERFAVLPYNLTNRYLGPAGAAGIAGGMLLDSVGTSHARIINTGAYPAPGTPYLIWNPGYIEFGQLSYAAGGGGASFRMLIGFGQYMYMTVTHKNYIVSLNPQVLPVSGFSGNIVITVANRVTGASFTKTVTPPSAMVPGTSSYLGSGYLTFVGGPTGATVMWSDQVLANFPALFAPRYNAPFVTPTELFTTSASFNIYDIQFYNDALSLQDVVASAQGGTGS